MKYLLIVGAGGNVNIYNLGQVQTFRYLVATKQLQITFAGTGDNLNVADPDRKYFDYVLRSLGSDLFDSRQMG